MKRLTIVFICLTSLFWWACSSGPTEPEKINLEIHSLAVGGPNQVFITSHSGLCQSLDNGDTWECLKTEVDGLVAVSPSGIIYCMKKVAGVKMGSHDEVLYRSTDKGKTFIPTGWMLFDTFDGMGWLTFNREEHLFGEVRGIVGSKGIYRSTSSGESWERVRVTIGSSLYKLHLIAPDKIFLSDTAIHRSDDNGDSWIKVLDPQDVSGDTKFYFGPPLAFNSQGRIFAAIGVSRNTDSVATGTVYHSDNEGHTWIKSIVAGGRIIHLAVNSEDKVFALNTLNEVYRSIDNGNQWDKVNVNSVEGRVMKFIINPNNTIFILTSSYNLYRSKDEGVSWQLIQPQL